MQYMRSKGRESEALHALLRDREASPWMLPKDCGAYARTNVYIADLNTHVSGVAGRDAAVKELGHVLFDWGIKAKSQVSAWNAAMRVYIPTIRTTRAATAEFDPKDAIAADVGRSLFGNQLPESDRQACFAGTCEIISGQDFYPRLRRDLTLSRMRREAMDDLQDFISRRFLQGLPFELIPKEEGGKGISHCLYAKVGKEEERPLYLLGDGLAQIVIMLYPLFLYRDKSLFLFIEEPELYLHPGMQRVLIEAMVNDERDGGVPVTNGCFRQVFVTTHSPCFLDMTLDPKRVAVFHVAKQPNESIDHTPEFRVTVKSAPDKPLLQELGARNTSLLLTNCTIWVDGPSDRKYITHYLRLYSEKDTTFKAREGIEYTVAMYSGNVIKHYFFGEDENGIGESEGKLLVDRMCGTALVVVDDDGASSTHKKEKHKRFSELADQLGDRFHRHPVREIENLLDVSALRRAIIDWSKDELTDSDFNSVEHAHYKAVPLGSFIRDKFLIADKRPSRKLWESESGYCTIAHKVEFADSVTATLTEYDQLSEEAKAFTVKLVAHILKHQ